MRLSCLAPTVPDSLRLTLTLHHGWTRMPTRYTSSADTHAMVARIAPSILGCLVTAYQRVLVWEPIQRR